MSTSMENLRQDVRKNPAELEREADLARDAVEGTLHELEQQLSPSELVHRVIDSVKLNAGGFGENLVAQVRSNPVPAVLTGVGLAWLMLTPKRPADGYGATARSSPGESFAEGGAPEGGDAGLRGQWSSAVDSAHEAASEAGDAVGGAAAAAANAARTAASTVKSAAHAATNAASRAASATRRATEGMSRVSQGGVQRVTKGYSYLSREQPLVLGALAVVVGAAIGAMLPSTDAEDGWLGDLSDEAKMRLKSEAHTKADDLQAAAMSAATTVQQSMSKAATGDGAAASPGAHEMPSDDTTNSQDTAPDSGGNSTA